MTADAPQSQAPQSAEKFGTFLGVYTPSVLTILGLIMYLRFGWVVGNVGLPLTLLIVLLASSMTFITALSASAIATNMRVGVGGEYYMVAHSLGLELGGAIGIPLFLCRTLSITFYSYGLAESIVTLFPTGSGPGSDRLGADHRGRHRDRDHRRVGQERRSGAEDADADHGRGGALAASPSSSVSLTGDQQAPEIVATYRTAPEGFWFVFAVFFPAVTGFTAGIGLSGDLKDPRRRSPAARWPPWRREQPSTC